MSIYIVCVCVKRKKRMPIASYCPGDLQGVVGGLDIGLTSNWRNHVRQR